MSALTLHSRLRVTAIIRLITFWFAVAIGIACMLLRSRQFARRRLVGS